MAGDFIAVPLVVDAIDCGLRQPRPDADGVDRGCTGESPRAISCAFIALIAMYGLIYYVSHALRTFPLTHLEQYCVRRFTQNALIRRATRPATRVILVIGVDEFTIFMSFLLVPIKVRFATLEPAMRCVTRCVDVALCIVASTRNASFCCQDICPWRSPRFLVLLFTYVPSIGLKVSALSTGRRQVSRRGQIDHRTNDSNRKENQTTKPKPKPKPIYRVESYMASICDEY